MSRRLVAVVGVLVLFTAMAAVAVAGAASGQGGKATGYRTHGMMSSSPWNEPGWRQDSRGWTHGSAVGTEFTYLTEMVAHHEEAVLAAEGLRLSNRPQMRAFGASIVETQSAQIQQMNSWLAQWYPGRSSDVDYKPMMRDLSGLSGDDLDQAFLRDMIVHHMTAVMMSQHLLVRGVAEHERVNALAASIRDEQHAEIFQMRQWLADWFGTGWEPGSGSGMMPGTLGDPTVTQQHTRAR